MANWQDTGDEWTLGLIPLCDSDFDCTESKYYLKNNHTLPEAQHLAYNNEEWLKEEHSRTLYILTFPAYCRYRALIKRLQDGASFTRTQIIALGGVIADHKNTRVVFCRNCFHHPYLDKFELSGETKAPVLKGRPRKKRRLHGVPNSVLSKKRFVADIQNHLVAPATKKSKFSEEEEGTESDRSEGVLEKIRSLPQVVNGVQNKKGPPPLVKPKMPAVCTERTNVEVKKVVAHDVSHRQKIPPPLIPSHKVKFEVTALNPSQARSNQRQNELTVNLCERNSSLVQLKSSDLQANDVQKAACHPSVVTFKPALAERIQAKVNAVSVISSATDAVVTSTKHPPEQNSAGLDNCRSQPVIAVTNSKSVMPAKSLCNTQASTRPATSVQAGICNKLVTSTRPVVRVQPLAPKPSGAGLQPVTSDTLLTTSLQSITTPSPACSVTSSRHLLSGGVVSSSSTDAKHVETSGSETTAEMLVEEKSETRQPRLRSDSERTDENEVARVEPIVWQKKKRLRMPGNIKDEEYQDEDEKYFMQSLRDFMKSRNTPLGKIPALGFKKVNLWTMYTTAQRFGGYDAVTSKRMWRRVYDSLGGSTTITSAATYTRRHYERLLLPYERYIRSQLKDKVDKKVSASPHSNNKLIQREPSVLSAKQVTSHPVTVTNNTPNINRVTSHPVTVANNKPETNGHHPGADSSTAIRFDQPDLKTSTATVPFKNSIHTTVNVDKKLQLVDQQPWNASTTSGPGQRSVTVPEDVKVSSKPDLSCTTPTLNSQQSQKTWSQNGNGKFWAADTRTNVATSQQNVDLHYGPFLEKDDQSSARTSVVYTKSLIAGPFHGNSPKEVPSGHRAPRRQNIEKVQVSPVTLVDEVGKEREVIDLTIDDSLPQIHHSPGLGFGSQESLHKKSEESELLGQRVSSQWRDTGHLQGYAEHHPSAPRHCSIGVSIKSVDVPSAQGMESYSPPQSPKTALQMQEYSRAQTVYKGNNEKYSSNKYEGSYHAQDRMMHPRVETMYRSTAHSPSLESVDEHFAEWHRRRSSLQPQKSGHSSKHLRKPNDHELAHLRYTYLNEDMCDQDCACSAPKKRKDSTLQHQPHVKKEHYEDDIPFSGMHVYPTSWTPPVVADHPDLFISSHPSHMQGSPDALASHMCTASRIFLPQAQIFSSPYHMGMAPMGAPPLLTGSDDRLHIHPHCLISSPYPCTSNSRASDTGGYPLYSFT